MYLPEVGVLADAGEAESDVPGQLSFRGELLRRG
jgi:hypothetical protein